MRFGIIFLFFTFLLGCNNQNLSTTDKALVENLQVQMQSVNKLIKELDLLLIEFQKNDELPEAIEMMETASGEANKILGTLQTLKIQNNSLAEYTNKYEAALAHYTSGLKLQMDGMKNWDGQKTTEGYKQTEQAKDELRKYYEEINRF